MLVLVCLCVWAVHKFGTGSGQNGCTDTSATAAAVSSCMFALRIMCDCLNRSWVSSCPKGGVGGVGRERGVAQVINTCFRGWGAAVAGAAAVARAVLCGQTTLKLLKSDRQSDRQTVLSPYAILV